MHVTLELKGDLSKTSAFLRHFKKIVNSIDFDSYGQKGVEALKSITPHRSGKTADAWYYKISKTANTARVMWNNTNENKGYNIALIIQYGHGTKNGCFIEGQEYINESIRPVFEEFCSNIWREVYKK